MNRLIYLGAMLIWVAACTTKRTPAKIESELSGTWELNYISGPRITFEGLYPNKKPFLKVESDSGRISGNTGCNNFNGSFRREGNGFHVNEGMMMTKMFCVGQGESTFLSTLQQIDRYALSDNGNTLNLLKGDVGLMRFKRVK